MNTLLNDLRYACRTLARAPGFTTVAILTLALGIGATTAIFSVVNGVLLQPLPYPEPDRIVRLWQVDEGGGQMNLSEPNFDDWKAETRSFSALAQHRGGIASISGGSEPVRAVYATVSGDFFSVLGVQPVRGRLFLPEEQEQGAPAVVVSHAFWERYLAADANLANAALTFGNRVHSVVGVMPPGFAYPANAEVWAAYPASAPVENRTAHNWQVIGRLANNTTLTQARQELTTISRRLKQRYGDDTAMSDAAIIPLHETLVGHVRPALYVLLGAAALLLLIACANVTNLMLARAASKQRELSVRVALGAGRWRLTQQFLSESLMLALIGCALGVLFATWGVAALLAVEPGNLPRLDQVGVSWPVLLFSIAISVCAALALGLAAAARATSVTVRASLAENQRTSAGGGRAHRLRGALVVSQVALALVLLVGAGLLGRSFLQLLAVDPGFRTTSTVTMSLSLPYLDGDDAETARLSRFHEDLTTRLQAIPGLEAIGGTNNLPLDGGGSNGTFIIMAHPHEIQDFDDFGRLANDDSRTGYANFSVANEDYFRAMEIPLVSGRLFAESDHVDAPHVAVISQSLADRRWPEGDAIGKLIQFGNMDGDMRAFTIVGVVGDVRDRGVETAPTPTFYGSSRQRLGSSYSFTYVLHGTAQPATVIASARRIVAELAPDVPPRFSALDELFATSLAGRRFSLLLLGVFGATALVLAAMGIYGVTSYSVAQRTRETGVRMALGAQSGDVVRMVVAREARLAITGVALGLIASLGLTRLVASMLYGVSPIDPLTFAAVAALLASAAGIAAYIPARRATRVDPMVALRSD